MRPPRINIEGGVYHVTTRCNNKEFFFQNDADFLLFLKMVKLAKIHYQVEVYGYCLTNNHTHLLLGTPNNTNLSKFMQFVNGNFAKKYNKMHNKSGRFWGGRFHSTLIESETQLLNTLIYIELNMVRCGAVVDPNEWPWSSYHAHSNMQKNYIVDFHPIYLKLGENAYERSQSYKKMVDEKMEELGFRKPAFSNGVVLGSEEFIHEIIDKYKSIHPFYQDRKYYAVVPSTYSFLRSTGSDTS